MSRNARIRDMIGMRWRGAARRRTTRRLDFLVIGVQKGGTTTLDRLLRLHPDIELPSRRKELHYFDDDPRFDGETARNGYSALQAEFYFDRRHAGEVTPSYIYWKPALERIRAYNPDARLIVLLRNPILRAWSHWGHLARKNEGATIVPFRERIQREQKALRRDPDFQDLGLSHIARSLYAPQITRLRALFPEESVLFVKSERFFADQIGVADEVCRFIGARALSAVSAPLVMHANAGSGSGITRDDWNAAHALLADDIDAVETLLGWDCSDWRRPPRFGMGDDE